MSWPACGSTSDGRHGAGRRTRIRELRLLRVLLCIPILFAGGCQRPPLSPHTISHSGAGAFEAALAATGDGGVAAWYDDRDGNAEIYLRELGADGFPSGAERRLTTDDPQSYEPSVAIDGDAVAVAWYDRAADGSLAAQLGMWTRGGGRRWVTTIAANARNPVVRHAAGRISVAWIQKETDGGEAVWLGAWTGGGERIGLPRRLGPAHRTTWNVNAAVDSSGAVWVVFDAVASTKASELFLARADERDVTLTRLTTDDGRESKYPDVAIANGRAAVTWYDARDGNNEVYLFVASSTDFSGEIDARSRRVTTTSGESIGAYVVWNGDRIGLAWSDDTAGQHEVYFQAFNAASEPLAAPSRLTDNATSSLVPAIVPWRDGFALAWNEYEPAPKGQPGKSEVAFVVVR